MCVCVGQQQGEQRRPLITERPNVPLPCVASITAAHFSLIPPSSIPPLPRPPLPIPSPTISCQRSMPPKQSSFSSRFIIPGGSGKKAAERALYKASRQLTSGRSLCSVLAHSLQLRIISSRAVFTAQSHL